MNEIRLWTCLKKYAPLFLLILVCAAASAGLAAVGPLLLGNATTVIFNGIMSKLNGTGRMDFDAIARILGTTLVLYLTSTLFAAVGSRLTAEAEGRLAHRLRRMMAEKLHVFPAQYYETHAAGETMARMTQDAETVGQNIAQGFWQLSTAVLTILGIVAMMIFISPVLAACAALVVPLSWAALWLMAGKSERYVRKYQLLQTQADARIEEYYTGREVIRAFGQEKEAAEAFRQSGTQLAGAAWKADFYSNTMPLVMQLFGNAAYVLTALLGGVLAFRGGIQVGGIQAYIHYIRILVDPIRQTAQSVALLQSAAAAWERIRTLLEEPEERELEACDAEGRAGTETRRASGEIRFEHVSFGYGEELVLRDFSAVIAPGQKAALTGVSGVGKTTLVKLLLRFYDCREGEIYVNGREIRTYGRAELRSRFGVVMQDVWLFRGTVLDNIRYGRPEASEEEARRAAAAASADAFIERLPEGYHTVIDEEQGGLSRGQKRLLAIARALLADPEILILDEATSSVDTKTERQIQTALQTLMKGRTCLIIAHRATTVRGADLVLRVE